MTVSEEGYGQTDYRDYKKKGNKNHILWFFCAVVCFLLIFSKIKK